MSAQTAAVERLLTPTEVAEALGIPQQTLYVWRTHGEGPRGLRIGKHLRYRAADLEAWIESRADDAR